MPLGGLYLALELTVEGLYASILEYLEVAIRRNKSFELDIVGSELDDRLGVTVGIYLLNAHTDKAHLAVGILGKDT